MDEQSLKKIIAQGETITVEFKSWIKADSIKERINLVVPERIAFANSKGGTVYLGIEDNGWQVFEKTWEKFKTILSG